MDQTTPMGTAEPLRDKNGLTEAEFLAQYRPGDYPRPSLTADNCVFRRSAKGGLQVLLVQRGGHPYLGQWALPGGFVSPGETCEQAAERELAEETGVEGLDFEPVGVYSAPWRDPRGWVVSSAYVALDETGQIPQAADDANDARWLDVAAAGVDGSPGRVELTIRCGETVLTSNFVPKQNAISQGLHAAEVENHGFAFDHAHIVADAWLVLRASGKV